jgi:hypothetical protein
VILAGPAPAGVWISNVVVGGLTVLLGLGMTGLEAMGGRRNPVRAASQAATPPPGIRP